MADDRKLDFDRYILAPTHEEQPPNDPDEDDEPQGGDVDTDHRCCLGSELTGHEPDCIHSTLASMNQHIEQLEQDLDAGKARISILEAALKAEVAAHIASRSRLEGELALAKSSLGSVPMPEHTKLVKAVGALVEVADRVVDQLARQQRNQLMRAINLVAEALRG